MNVSFFQELLSSISDSGRALLERASGDGATAETIEELSRALVGGRGEASGVAIARELLNRYAELSDEDKAAFFSFLAESFGPDVELVQNAAKAFADDPSDTRMRALSSALVSPREEFFRRLNLAPGATAAIVHMREDLFGVLRSNESHSSQLKTVDADIAALLALWFNRGFLVLRRLDWDAPASILDKIIEYEAVHEIDGWEDLRRRLDPSDRRCFGFFHPSLVDDPLIFVEVALTHAIPSSIQDLLAEDIKEEEETAPPTTAVFYSISNCQKGLRGISFGNFLIKQVVEDLAKEIPSLNTFVTLSPVPGFSRWVQGHLSDAESPYFTDEERMVLQRIQVDGWHKDEEFVEGAEPVMMALASEYFLHAKRPSGQTAFDPVSHFHLRNGALIENICWLGDTSAKGMRQSFGFMVNYLYDLREIERNHENYENDGGIAASKTVRALLPGAERDVDRTLIANDN